MNRGVLLGAAWLALVAGCKQHRSEVATPVAAPASQVLHEQISALPAEEQVLARRMEQRFGSEAAERYLDVLARYEQDTTPGLQPLEALLVRGPDDYVYSTRVDDEIEGPGIEYTDESGDVIFDAAVNTRPDNHQWVLLEIALREHLASQGYVLSRDVSTPDGVVTSVKETTHRLILKIESPKGSWKYEIGERPSECTGTEILAASEGLDWTVLQLRVPIQQISSYTGQMWCDTAATALGVELSSTPPIVRRQGARLPLHDET